MDAAKVNKDTDQKGSIWLLLCFHFLMYVSPGRSKEYEQKKRDWDVEIWEKSV